MVKENELDNKKVLDDFYRAYEAKRHLIKRQREDYEFRLGNQWKKEDVRELESKGVLPVTDNRVQSNIFLLTGLERQNRTDIKAFPEGEEDSLEAHIATSLIKNVMKQSNGEYKFSEAFEDGVTCGESCLELYLDNTYNFLTPRPKWKKYNFDDIFPEPGWKEYDFSDCSYVYKWTRGIKKDDLIALYPEKEKYIKNMNEGIINPQMMVGEEGGTHIQFQDYPAESQLYLENRKDTSFDLLERYYKKWSDRVFVVDHIEQTLTMVEREEGDDRDDEQVAKAFVRDVRKADPEQGNRYTIIKRKVPEIWVWALTGSGEEPLANEKAWFYPRWKGYPFMNYFSHWTSAPLSREDSHLNVQGVVAGVKSTQLLHNKSETLKLRHLNAAANSGWLTEEDAWVDREMVKKFGTSPGVNLEYKRGRPKPERITPMPISSGHELVSRDTSEAIKAQLGINADLLAVQQGGTDSGRAIALRQRQGIIMVQKLFDHYSWTKTNAGKFILSQLNEIYDLESVKRVIGQAWIARNFSVQVQGPEIDPMTGQPIGQPVMEIDQKKLNDTIKKVLRDADIGIYDVSVGEVIATETKRIADYQEIQQFSQQYPQLVDPTVIIESSQLPDWVKDKILGRVEQMKAQSALSIPAMSGGGGGGGGGGELPKAAPV